MIELFGGASRALLAAAALLIGATCGATGAEAAESELYRIFLRDGAALVSLGEYARVADRVVFPMPIGADTTATLQLVSIDASAVDWDRTEQYTLAVRARHYASTRGDNDFALLGNRVTEAMNDITLTTDPVRRLAMAEEARRNLARWPSENYGYRANEVAQLVSMLDEVVADLRAAAGTPGADLSLAATTITPPPVPLLPPPGARDTLEQAFSAARITPDAAERISLLQAIAAAIKTAGTTETWTTALGGRVSMELASELRLDRAYRELAVRTTTAAAARAARADVRGVEATLREAMDTDDRLGRKRPHEMSALLASLDARLDEARRLRLARDAWAARRELFAVYLRTVAPMVAQLRAARGWLDDVRSMAGPRPSTLDRHEQRVVMARQELERVTPPAELASAHSLYTAAFQMARRAAATRRNAVSSNDMNLARDASSAAAGALMLLERADEELGRLTTSPNR